MVACEPSPLPRADLHAGAAPVRSALDEGADRAFHKGPLVDHVRVSESEHEVSAPQEFGISGTILAKAPLMELAPVKLDHETLTHQHVDAGDVVDPHLCPNCQPHPAKSNPHDRLESGFAGRIDEIQDLGELLRQRVGQAPEVVR